MNISLVWQHAYENDILFQTVSLPFDESGVLRIQNPTGCEGIW